MSPAPGDLLLPSSFCIAWYGVVREALLQQSEDEADGSADLQPQADADAYKERSGSILDTLQSMKDFCLTARHLISYPIMSCRIMNRKMIVG